MSAKTVDDPLKLLLAFGSKFPFFSLLSAWVISSFCMMTGGLHDHLPRNNLNVWVQTPGFASNIDVCQSKYLHFFVSINPFSLFYHLYIGVSFFLTSVSPWLLVCVTSPLAGTSAKVYFLGNICLRNYLLHMQSNGKAMPNNFVNWATVWNLGGC